MVADQHLGLAGGCQAGGLPGAQPAGRCRGCTGPTGPPIHRAQRQASVEADARRGAHHRVAGKARVGRASAPSNSRRRRWRRRCTRTGASSRHAAPPRPDPDPLGIHQGDDGHRDASEDIEPPVHQAVKGRVGHQACGSELVRREAGRARLRPGTGTHRADLWCMGVPRWRAVGHPVPRTRRTARTSARTVVPDFRDALSKQRHRGLKRGKRPTQLLSSQRISSAVPGSVTPAWPWRATPARKNRSGQALQSAISSPSRAGSGAQLVDARHG